MRALAIVLAGLLLAGCASGPQVIAFPHELSEDCKVSKPLRYSTNEELTETSAELAKTLKLCNLDKKGIRQWATENSL